MKMELPVERKEELINLLKSRFEKNKKRHYTLEWEKVRLRLEANPEKLWSLNEMEESGGEPDVIDFDKSTGEFTFCDCSPESPKGRRSLCYDREALESRKEYKPKNSAIGMAAEMGIEILNEQQYKSLQGLGKFATESRKYFEVRVGVFVVKLFYRQIS